ncbi:hypothetical protein [Frigidibacter sp. SD6-1]|uniref:hypothetical protein n=1 Tax=Frigidibacter sp. SD6-1 TaxID=3032581 RepID=UPI0024DF75BC|nr:hypothetical protein [Frigidibacter sp. SD6-1]
MKNRQMLGTVVATSSALSVSAVIAASAFRSLKVCRFADPGADASAKAGRPADLVAMTMSY